MKFLFLIQYIWPWIRRARRYIVHKKSSAVISWNDIKWRDDAISISILYIGEISRMYFTSHSYFTLGILADCRYCGEADMSDICTILRWLSYQCRFIIGDKYYVRFDNKSITFKYIEASNINVRLAAYLAHGIGNDKAYGDLMRNDLIWLFSWSEMLKTCASVMPWTFHFHLAPRIMLTQRNFFTW